MGKCNAGKQIKEIRERGKVFKISDHDGDCLCLSKAGFTWDMGSSPVIIFDFGERSVESANRILY